MSARAWTPRRAAALSRRHLGSVRKAIEKHLGAIAWQWADENAYIEGIAEDAIRELVARLDEIEDEIAEVIAERGA